jgi:hypothetical protein
MAERQNRQGGDGTQHTTSSGTWSSCASWARPQSRSATMRPQQAWSRQRWSHHRDSIPSFRRPRALIARGQLEVEARRLCVLHDPTCAGLLLPAPSGGLSSLEPPYRAFRHTAPFLRDGLGDYLVIPQWAI